MAAASVPGCSARQARTRRAVRGLRPIRAAHGGPGRSSSYRVRGSAVSTRRPVKFVEERWRGLAKAPGGRALFREDTE